MVSDWRNAAIPFALPASDLIASLETIRDLATDSRELKLPLSNLFVNLVSALEVATLPAAILVAALPDRKTALASREILARLGRRLGRAIERPEASEPEALDVIACEQALLVMGRNPEIVEYVEISLRQANILVWAAFEVYANDLVEVFVNLRPHLLQTEGILRISRDSLGELLRTPRPGTKIGTDFRLRSLGAIKRFFLKVLPDENELKECLEGRILTLVAERRHLSAHRAGIVDETYIATTGEQAQIGTILQIAPSELELGVSEVAKASLLLTLPIGRQLGL
jgi:hypothetical protein